MDQVFQEEQAHLRETYGKLLQIEEESRSALQVSGVPVTGSVLEAARRILT